MDARTDDGGKQASESVGAPALVPGQVWVGRSSEWIAGAAFESYIRGEPLKLQDVDRYLRSYPYIIRRRDGSEPTAEERAAAVGRRRGRAAQAAVVEETADGVETAITETSTDSADAMAGVADRG